MKTNAHLPEYERGFLGAFEALDERLKWLENTMQRDDGTLPDVALVMLGGVRFVLVQLEDEMRREFERDANVARAVAV